MILRMIFEYSSGERVRNTWVTYLELGDSCGKLQVIPDDVLESTVSRIKDGDPSGPIGLRAAQVLSASW